MATKANSGLNRLSQEAIAQRAYELWEAEGRPEGRALDHWTQAEAMLRENGVPSARAAAAAANEIPARRQSAGRTNGRREKALETVS